MTKNEKKYQVEYSEWLGGVFKRFGIGTLLFLGPMGIPMLMGPEKWAKVIGPELSDMWFTRFCITVGLTCLGLMFLFLHPDPPKKKKEPIPVSKPRRKSHRSNIRKREREAMVRLANKVCELTEKK